MAERETKKRENDSSEDRGNGGNNSNNSDNRGGSGSTDLRDSPMMAHLLDALQAGIDVGHYGRLTFAMVARHFMDRDELLGLMAKQPDQDETKAKTMLLQVEERNYNPPKRERILEWQSQQDFQICPTPDDPQSCNVYSDLTFPDAIYDQISEYYEQKADE